MKWSDDKSCGLDSDLGSESDDDSEGCGGCSASFADSGSLTSNVSFFDSDDLWNDPVVNPEGPDGNPRNVTTNRGPGGDLGGDLSGYESGDSLLGIGGYGSDLDSFLGLSGNPSGYGSDASLDMDLDDDL